MNPPESVSPEYDRGYRDGYRDCRLENVFEALENVDFVTQQDQLMLQEITHRKAINSHQYGTIRQRT